MGRFNAVVSVSCPECSRNNDMKRHDQCTCSGCGTTFKILDGKTVWILETALIDGKPVYLTQEFCAEFMGEIEEPILVVRRSDGRYNVMDGHKRLAAYKALGRSYIAALIVGRVRDGS